MASATEFAFTVPQCERGVALRVTAPDGVTLQIPLPANAEPGDNIHLVKGADGKWGFKQIVRGATSAPAASTPSKPPHRSRAELEQELEGPDAVAVRLDTTKGPIFLKVHPSWSPNGVKRFLELVDDDYFREIAIYRGIPKFLIQFGVTNDPVRNSKYSKIPDDALCGVPYLDGCVGFAAAGPNTRTSTLCLFLGDAPHLGNTSVETPFGLVMPESMSTLHSIFLTGDIPQCGGKGACPIKLEEQGNEYIHANFPECDFVTGAARV
eukprot:TRINITY_DN16368_c0_g4_i1.p1 TRINITY_DN16368_c0_g4~~TRINITY_DN16368_c0_g4_i1.p1  ORF type:complete len:300 (-),score=45.77 TRINITY_DN16368_c0_g4_i1:142-939(-)